MKVKIIEEDSAHNLETKINDWFKGDNSIKIIFVTQCWNNKSGKLTTSIYYQ